MVRKKKKILITGATGFIGSNLAKALANNGEIVRCFVRKSSQKESINYLKKAGVEFAYGDLLNKEEIKKAVNGIDIVYHMAAVFNYNAKKDITFKVNVEGTKNILDACVDSKIKKLIYCSTIGVMGPTGKIPADEKKECCPVNTYYAQSKYEAEKLVRMYHKQYNLPVVIIRPSAVYGPRSMMGVGMFKFAAKGFNAVIGPGNNLVSFVYVDDAVKAFILAKEKGKSGETYIIADKAMTLEDLIKITASTMGTKPMKMHIPVVFMKIMAFLMDIKCRIFGGENPLPSAAIDFIISDHVYDISKAKKELGYAPKTRPEKGMKRTAEWYKIKGCV